MAEEPKYTILHRQEGYEIREYAPAVIAEVVVEGPYRYAMNRGFNLLADYIFGNNRRRESVPMTKPVTASERIPMTAPVIASESLPMTAPVTISEQGPMTAPGTEASGSGETWRVAFFAPSRYSLHTMPVPNNPAVHLRQLPKRKLAVLRFRGLATAQRVERERESLRAMLARDGLHPLGQGTVARFNPPFVPAPFMHNEIQVEIAEDPSERH